MSKITSFDQLPITLRAEDVAEILGVSRANAYVIMHSISQKYGILQLRNAVVSERTQHE